jgi:hypothetical protein
MSDDPRFGDTRQVQALIDAINAAWDLDRIKVIVKFKDGFVTMRSTDAAGCSVTRRISFILASHANHNVLVAAVGASRRDLKSITPCPAAPS